MESYIKSICKKFGVFANDISNQMPLKTPFTSQSIAEHLEMIFPGLGNRIKIQDDLVLETSRDISSEPADRSTLTALTMPRDGMTPAATAREFSARKSPLFPSTSMFESAITGKRFKPDDVGSSFATSSPIADDEPTFSICKENFNKCIRNFAGVFDHIFDLNMQLEQQLKGLELKQALDIKALEDENAQLNRQVERLNRDMKNELDVMEKTYYAKVREINEENEEKMRRNAAEVEKQFGRRLKLAKEKHEKEIGVLKAKYDRKLAEQEAERRRIFMESYELMEKKNEECDQAVEEARKQMKREYSALIEDAKGKKFCIACGVGKPLDLYYVCDVNCQRSYWWVGDRYDGLGRCF